MSLGWLVGFLASPYTSEGKSFAKYASLISVFFSGYALAQIEPAVALVFGEARVLTVPVYGVRVVVFGISFVVAAIVMYVFRLYSGPNPE